MLNVNLPSGFTSGKKLRKFSQGFQAFYKIRMLNMGSARRNALFKILTKISHSGKSFQISFSEITSNIICLKYAMFKSFFFGFLIK